MVSTYYYARASTDKQVHSCSTQKGLAEEYAARNKLRLDGGFIDNAKSAKTSVYQRKGGAEMMRTLRDGDNLIVAHLDRLSRSFINFTIVVDDLVNRGINIHVIDMPGLILAKVNPIGMMLANILVMFGEYERKAISTRTKEGFAEARANGRRTSRHAPYGWRLVEAGYNKLKRKPDYILEPDHAERAIMGRVIEMKMGGFSYKQITNYLNMEWKVLSRSGGRFSLDMVWQMYQSGITLAAEISEADSALAIEASDPGPVEKMDYRVSARMKLIESEGDYGDE